MGGKEADTAGLPVRLPLLGQHSSQTSDAGNKYPARWPLGERTVGSTDLGVHRINYGCMLPHLIHRIFFNIHSCTRAFIWSVTYIPLCPRFEIIFQHMNRYVVDKSKGNQEQGSYSKSTYLNYYRWDRNSPSSFFPTKAELNNQTQNSQSLCVNEYPQGKENLDSQ